MKANNNVANRLHVTVAYEDVASGKRAKELFDRINSDFGDELKITTRLWKFDVMGVPSLQEMATRDAEAADVVVIASTNPGEPPAEVQAWVEQWLPRQSETHGALVSLCEIGTGNLFTLPAISSYCRRIARRVGMVFFCDRDPELHADAGSDCSGAIHRRAETVSSLMQQMLSAQTGSPALARA